MADKNAKASFQHRGDTLENWSTKNPVLKDRELGVVFIPASTQGGTATILLKVGDGTAAFNDLPYVSATANDVSAWAKAATKPEYAATEIVGLADYIGGKVQDTNTQYKIEQDTTDKHMLKVFSKNIGDEDFTLVTTIVTPDTVYDDTELANRVTAVEGKTSTLIGDDTDKSVRTIANEELAKQLIPDNAKESLDTLAEIATWIQSHPDDAASMNTAISALQVKLTLGADEDSVEYTTVKAYVEAAIAALKIGDYATAANLTALADRVTTLEGKATKVEKSDANGNVKIDGAEVEVYALPDTVLDVNDTICFDGGHA